MTTREGILKKHQKTSTAYTTRKMDTSSKNVSSGIIMIKNKSTISRRITKKSSAGRKKNITRKKEKSDLSQEKD